MAAPSPTKQYVAEVLCIILALTPLFFLPITQNYYDTNKWMILLLVAVAMFILWLVTSIKASSCTISVSPAAIGFGAIAIASLISLFAASTNKVEAILSTFGPTTFVALAAITTITPTLIGKETALYVRWVLYGASGTLGLIALYEAFGVGKIMFPAGSFLADPLWTPTGATTSSAALFAIMLPLTLADASEAAKDRKETTLAFLIILSLVEAVGLGVSLWHIIPNIPTNILSLNAAWSIMLETMKNVKQALVGVGAENFLTAFVAGRPVSLNLTPLWNQRFALGSNLLFHIMTTYGLLGGVATLVLLKGMVTKARSLFTASLIVCAAAFLLVPPNLTTLVISALLVALTPQQKPITIKSPFRGKMWIGIPVTVALVAPCLFAVFFLGNAYWADMLVTKSLAFARENNGTQTYNLQVKAIKAMPQLPAYHILLSDTTMAMALTLASTPQLSESDRQLIAQLVQQSIQDAKTAVSLNPRNILAWENAARLYGQLIGVAQGADVWSQTAYGQATQMDPTNPSLHLELGALLVRTKNYTQAITQFQLATALKPNYSNAFYNLSNAYKLNGDIPHAISAIEQVIPLVDKNSDDYRIATRALADLKKSEPGLPTTSTTGNQSATGAATLTTPTPAVTITPTVPAPNLLMK